MRSSSVPATLPAEDTLKQRARDHSHDGWARWEIPSLIRDDARRMGVEITREQSERIVREAVPQVTL